MAIKRRYRRHSAVAPAATASARPLRQSIAAFQSTNSKVIDLIVYQIPEERHASVIVAPPGRRSGCWPHDGEVAGGAVADSYLVISGIAICLTTSALLALWLVAIQIIPHP